MCLVAGNHEPGGSLAPITLRTYLNQISKYGQYAGLAPATDLSDAQLDQKVSIRFQTCFLPVETSNGRSTFEFSPESYNYQTRSDADPRNLVILATTQGVALQQDGVGSKKLFHHAVDSGRTHRYYLEAEQTTKKVGGAQTETQAEKADALARGKATTSVIGTQAMGTRFNVLMTIQVPLQQQQKQLASNLFGATSPATGGALFGAATCPAPSTSGALFGAASNPFAMTQLFQPTPNCAPPCGGLFGAAATPAAGLFSASATPAAGGGLFGAAAAPTAGGGLFGAAPGPTTGVANAARVSRGSEVDIWNGLGLKSPARDPSQHVTVTVVIYNTVAGGVPSDVDVKAAIDDMELLYRACGWSGRLTDTGTVDFMKTANDKAFPGLPTAVSNANTFPTQPPAPPQALFGDQLFAPLQKLSLETCNLVKSLPLKDESHEYLHDTVAIPMLAAGAAGGKLGEAFHIFQLVNDFTTQLHGVGHGAACYNMACCLSLAAQHLQQPALQAMLNCTAPSMISPSSAMVVTALDTALRWFLASAAFGWCKEQHCGTDPDIAFLRENRPEGFNVGLQVMSTMSR